MTTVNSVNYIYSTSTRPDFTFDTVLTEAEESSILTDDQSKDTEDDIELVDSTTTTDTTDSTATDSDSSTTTEEAIGSNVTNADNPFEPVTSTDITNMSFDKMCTYVPEVTETTIDSTSSTVNGINDATAGTYGGVSLTEEQVENAEIIAKVGKEMGASARDIEIAIATAMQESQLKNLSGGDRDSVGLFQQRPSCGWGTVAQCTTPEYAARKFFEKLLKISNRDSMSVTQAAQKVQVSAYPNAYAKWENMALALTNAIVS